MIFRSSQLDCEIKMVRNVDQTSKLEHQGQKGGKKDGDIPHKTEREREVRRKKRGIGVTQPKDAPLVIWKVVCVCVCEKGGFLAFPLDPVCSK